MIRRMRNDLRGLLPILSLFFGVMVIAALVVRFFPPLRLQVLIHVPNDESIVVRYCDGLGVGIFIFGYLGLHLIAVSLWGKEFRDGAMGRLLAQPISRTRLWMEKMLVYALTGAAFIVLCWIVRAQMFSWINRRDQLRVQEINNVLGIATILLAGAGGPFATFYIRQTHTAFWAALVFPIAALLIATSFLILIDRVWLSHHGPAILDLIMKAPEWAGGMLSYYWNVILPVDAWCLIIYPLSWLKFRRLEV